MICEKCKIECKKRQTKPRTASQMGHLYFDYYQCPKCKTNYAKVKGE